VKEGSKKRKKKEDLGYDKQNYSPAKPEFNNVRVKSLSCTFF
jgi:hypothetical protein